MIPEGDWLWTRCVNFAERRVDSSGWDHWAKWAGCSWSRPLVSDLLVPAPKISPASVPAEVSRFSLGVHKQRILVPLGPARTLRCPLPLEDVLAVD